ncbi:hypothetical protein HZB08_01585, partial [Candidatus Saganbacteria bacterium]|nr:hypothetical protein [Candidatus Saganbacteria bacterium]
MINTIVILAVPLLLGAMLLAPLLRQGFNPGEKLALAFSLGLGFLTIIMFLLTMA